MISNLLVMLCVDDELLCLCLLCEFISLVIQYGIILHMSTVDGNS